MRFSSFAMSMTGGVDSRTTGDTYALLSAPPPPLGAHIFLRLCVPSVRASGFWSQLGFLLARMALRKYLELISRAVDRPSSCACRGDSDVAQRPLLLRIFVCPLGAHLLGGASFSSSLGCKCGLYGVTLWPSPLPPPSPCA